MIGDKMNVLTHYGRVEKEVDKEEKGEQTEEEGVRRRVGGGWEEVDGRKGGRLEGGGGRKRELVRLWLTGLAAVKYQSMR